MSMQVTAITRKRKPVWASILSEVTPSESSVMKRVAYEPRYLAYLRDSLAIKGVRSVVMHEALTNLRKVMFLQIAHGTPRTEIWRALHGAASLQADIGKYVIAVSEDIDARNPDAVFWSLAYRANPIKDVQISPYRSEGHGPKSEGGGREESTMLVDATLKDTNPPISLPKREFMEHARAIWDELGLPKLKPQSPWHGYSLGDWDAVWDTYAERAVTGQWEETGKETFAHRRGGLTPETPVKGVKN
jgi:4-hydroxy-3-polyprenylbenzoate decarboxylase